MPNCCRSQIALTGLGFSVILSSENIVYVAEVKSFKHGSNELQFYSCDILLQTQLPFTLYK